MCISGSGRRTGADAMKPHYRHACGRYWDLQIASSECGPCVGPQPSPQPQLTMDELAMMVPYRKRPRFVFFSEACNKEFILWSAYVTGSPEMSFSS